MAAAMSGVSVALSFVLVQIVMIHVIASPAQHHLIQMSITIVGACPAGALSTSRSRGSDETGEDMAGPAMA